MSVDDLYRSLFNEVFGVSFEELGVLLLELSDKGKVSAEYADNLIREYVNHF